MRSKIADTMEIENSKHTTTISEFYKGKNVFLTGATGFVGKALIEKLLRSCPDVGNVYILVRPKKGRDLKERVEHMLKDLLFNTLKQTSPSQLSKLIPLLGDCSQLNLGLSVTDYHTITSSVSIIYHIAASVRFDDPLKHAILLNTRGTRELALLALQSARLLALVYVSTTYCNCVVGRQVKEEVYPMEGDWRKAIAVAERMDQGELAVWQDKYLGEYPNTYTFTKALGEYVVKDLLEGKVPTVVCRPSIVVNTWKDPVQGWVDNFNGPVGLLIAAGKGLLRCSYQDPNINADYIPVDVTVRALIVASWDLGLRQYVSKVEVIHCSSNHYNWLTFGDMTRLGRELSYDIPLNDSIWVPKGSLTQCRVYAYLCAILFHLLPACFLDLGLKVAGKKPMLMRLQTKIYNAALQLRFDYRSLNTKIFFENAIFGGRRYLLHESDESLPKAKIHFKRMYWLDKITMLILYGSLCWLVLHFGLVEKTVDKLYNSGTYYFDGKAI